MPEKSPKLRLPARTPENTVTELLADDVILLQRAGELRYMNRATLRAAVPSAPAPTMQPYAQQRHDPTGPFLTANVQPYGVTLANPNSNVLWNRFGRLGPDKNVTSRALIDQQYFDRSIFGDRKNPLANDQRNLSNFKSAYAKYNEFLSDGVTPDPRNLLILRDDYLEMVMRRTMALSSDQAFPLEQAFMRLGLPILVGDYVQYQIPRIRTYAASALC